MAAAQATLLQAASLVLTPAQLVLTPAQTALPADTDSTARVDTGIQTEAALLAKEQGRDIDSRKEAVMLLLTVKETSSQKSRLVACPAVFVKTQKT